MQLLWTVYLKQFVEAAESNVWDKREKVTALVLTLRGDTLDVRAYNQ